MTLEQKTPFSMWAEHLVAPRIRRVSGAVKLVAHALCWVFAILGLLGASMVVEVVQGSLHLPLSVALSVLVGLVSWSVLFRQVAKLAERYEAGELFTLENARCLWVIGLLSLSLCIGVGLRATESGASAELFWHPSAVAIGVVIMLVAWLTDYARRLRERG